MGISGDFSKTVKGWLEIIHPDYIEIMKNHLMEHVLRNKNQFNYEYKIIRMTDKQVRWVHGKGELDIDEKGNVVSMIGTIQDITERKIVESKLLESEALNREVQRIAKLGHWEWKVDVDQVRFSEVLRNMLGLDEKELLSFNEFLEFVHPDDFARVDACRGEKMKEYLADGIEYKIVNRKGETIFVYSQANIAEEAEGKPTRLIGTVHDITEKKIIQDNLQKTQFSIDQARDAVYWIKSDASITYANESACQLLGYTKEELKFMTVFDLDPNFTEKKWKQHWANSRNKGSYTIETLHKTKSGQFIPVEISINYMVFNNEEYHCSFSRDISERRKSEEALKLSEARLSEAQKITHVGNFDWDIIDNELFWSDEIYRIFDIKPGTPNSDQLYFERIHPEDRKKVQEALNYAIENNSHYSIDHRIIRTDGEVRYTHAEGKLSYNSQGQPVRMFGTIQDINDIKLTEEKLKSSLIEKEVLLKELYHRTKNNMQVISSMLALQVAKIDSPEIQNIFKETRNRIHTMALVHQKLYQSQNLSYIDLYDYFKELSNLLFKSYAGSYNKVRIIHEIDNINVLIDLAIPCGLILNELLSNSFKHAFPEERKGDVNICVKQNDDGLICLKYKDNGIGVPEEFNFREQETLGIQSIFSIGEHQLRGKVEFISNNGLQCTIEFMNSHYTRRV